MKNIAVILAGGKGVRLGYNKPKQFLKVAGKLIIEHTIDVFQKHEEIDEIVVVSHKDYIYLVEELVNKNNFNKVKKILNGGNERSDSSLVAIKAYENENVNLIFHDAVRPLVSFRIISDCIEALQKYNAVDVAIPATDTIIEVEDNFISNIPNRDRLNRGQTPQAFKLETIKKAYELALKDKNFIATDDCGVVKKYLPNEKIYVVRGEESNIKLTYEEDLFLLDKLFQIKSITLKHDDNSLAKVKDKVVVIFGGSYGIGKDIKDLALQNGAIVHSFSRSENNINIANKEDIQKALQSVYEKEKRIDYIINTAGILNKESLNNLDYKTIKELIDINYFGPIALAKESFKYLKETKGHLLFFTSSSYTRGRANYSLYSSSKAAIVNFTQAISSEWDIFDIKVNCVNPERTLTPMRIKNFGKEDPKTLLSSLEVAKVSLSVLSKNITGQIIDVKKEK